MPAETTHPHTQAVPPLPDNNKRGALGEVLVAEWRFLMPRQSLWRQCANVLRASSACALLAAAALQAPLALAAAPTESVLMPKAAQSLLLDIARAGERLVIVGERGHVLLSDDQGKNWKQVVVPTAAMLTAVYFPTPTQGWAVGHDGVILATQDGGNTWSLQRDGGGKASEEPVPPLMDVWFKDENSGWAVGAFGVVLETLDGGKTWADISDRLDNPDGFHINAITGDAAGNIYAGSESGVVFRSTFEGARWDRLESGYEGSFFGMLVTSEPSAIFGLGLRGSIMRSLDGGASWQRLETGTDASFAGGVQAGGVIYVVGSSGVLLVSRDGGDTFAKSQLEGNQSLASVFVLAGEQVLAVGQDGVRTLSVPAADQK